MKLADIVLESKETATRAGIIPYHIDMDGTVRMLFMVPSNSAYGGSRPSIAKGRVDKGETVIKTALREGAEELGLKTGNMIGSPVLVNHYKISGMDASYTMSVYLVKVTDPEDFNKPHYETKSTHWLTKEEFDKTGRPTQKEMVKDASRKTK